MGGRCDHASPWHSTRQPAAEFATHASLGALDSIHELPDGAFVLPLTLQPLLENAVAHGIQPRIDGGEVRVYGRSEKDNVVITICNPLGPADHISPGNGMALINIRERLHLAFGPAASLITHQDDKQFFAVLSLPYAENTDH